MTEFGTELARLMTARGVGMRELAGIVPCNPGHISNLRAGKARPSPELAAALDERLQADGTLAALAPAPAPRRHAAVGRDDTGAADEIAALDFARRAQVTEAGTGTVEQLELAVDELATAYPGTPPGELLGRVRAYLGYVGTLLDGRVTLAEHRRLLVVGGWLSLLAATTLIDLHRDHAAAAHLRTAAQLARETGHAEITAWCLETQAWQVLTQGDYRRGRDLPGRPAHRPEVRQRVHPGHGAGRARLGAHRGRPRDTCRIGPRGGAGVAAAAAGPARAPLPVRPGQVRGVHGHHAGLAGRPGRRALRPAHPGPARISHGRAAQAAPRRLSPTGPVPGPNRVRPAR